MPTPPPGPPLPRLLQSILWITRPIDFVEACHRRYGDAFTVRLFFGNDLIVLARPDLIHAAGTSAGDDLHAGEANGALLEPMVGSNSVLILDGAEHMRQRKLLLPAFHGERMRAWESVITDVARERIAAMPRGRPFALRPVMQRLTIEVILRVVFGLDDERTITTFRHRIGDLTALSSRPLGIAMSMNRSWGGRSPWARFLQARAALDAVIFDQISRHRRAGDAATRSDVLSTLLLARDEHGEPMTDVEIRDELVTLLLAGHETTATSLAWCLDLLTHAPQRLRRLEEEIRAGAETRYLAAVIQETLRLRPPVFVVVRRAMRPVSLGDHLVLRGQVLAPSVHLLHRNPALHAQPGEFRPERFLDHPPEARSWIPFGGGIRRCLGAAFATLEMRITLVEMLQALHVEAASPAPERPRREAVTLVPDHGVRVIVRERRGTGSRRERVELSRTAKPEC